MKKQGKSEWPPHWWEERHRDAQHQAVYVLILSRDPVDKPTPCCQTAAPETTDAIHAWL